MTCSDIISRNEFYQKSEQMVEDSRLALQQEKILSLDLVHRNIMGDLVEHERPTHHVLEMNPILHEPNEEGCPSINRHLFGGRFPGAVDKKAYKFYGNGNYCIKEWDLVEGQGSEFCWYQVQLPKVDKAQLSMYLIDVLCPPLKLRDILSLVKDGPFCGNADDALIFRVTSADPASTSFTFKLAVRVTENSVITVSQGRIPSLGFSSFKQSLLYKVPRLEPLECCSGQQQEESSELVISKPKLRSLLSATHSEEADYSVPRSVSNLVIHIIDTNVVHLENVSAELEMELDALEHDINADDSARRRLLQDRSFAELRTKLQRISQVIAHGEQVLPQVKRKCSSKQWFAEADVSSLEEHIGRLRRLKENVGIISKRAKSIQAGLVGWQSNQINRKLYYISFFTMIFLPLSLLTGVFGMNVGGLPWTSRKGHLVKDGFRNVMLLCLFLVIAVLVCFGFQDLHSRLFGECGKKTRVDPIPQPEAIPEETYGSIRASGSPV